ncbi:MAG: methylated-DNA--[protein]-cysteine S-methyltransferase [Oscillospiraceae bacterium]|jgi:methylated-DNA-[protein]-cysteine S-methyltransferase|nr:methylated-DNA--[protein]-cysteine S-methyltransferase [Oscillospiraceae bacterium]
MDIFTCEYQSPIGGIVAASQNDAVVGLWFENQKYFPNTDTWRAAPDKPPLIKLRAWLDAYFDGGRPGIDFAIAPGGSEFRQKVWRLLLAIPYGETTTYGAIAAKIAAELGKTRFSAQAVGGAIGHNPISLVIPCHRVIGANGSLTGYAGGLDKKQALLKLEQRP